MLNFSHRTSEEGLEEAAVTTVDDELSSSKLALPDSARADSPSLFPSMAPISLKRVCVGEPQEWESRMGQDGAAEAAPNPNKSIIKAGGPVASRQPDQRQDRNRLISSRSEPAGPQRPLSRRDIARLKIVILSSGIKAMEISRRAHTEGRPSSDESTAASRSVISWADKAQLGEESPPLRVHPVALGELYGLAARALTGGIQASGQRWQAAAGRLATQTSPELQRRIAEVRVRLADGLSEKTRAAAAEADEASYDLTLGQQLRVQRVTDKIDAMMRRHRRRFRWVRRALWLVVEWLLVGLMWYVWFVVTVLRIVVGVARGSWHSVRWILWI